MRGAWDRNDMDISKAGLIKLLHKQAEVQARLLTLEERKSQVLIKGSVEDLNEILNAEQPLLMQSSNLEKQRAELHQKLDLEKPELRRMLDHPEDAEEQCLAEAFLILRDAVDRLKKVSELNNKVLQARIDTKKNLMRICGLSDQAPTYSK